MSNSTQRIGRLLVGIAVAIAASIIVLPGNAATSAGSARAASCSTVVSENSCYRWSHRGTAPGGARLTAATRPARCAHVVSENSCYRWAHGGSRTAVTRLAASRHTSGASLAGGFDWRDGVDAAAGAGLVLLALGLAMVGGRRLKLREIS